MRSDRPPHTLPAPDPRPRFPRLVKPVSTDPGHGRRSYYRSPLLLGLSHIKVILVQILQRHAMPEPHAGPRDPPHVDSGHQSACSRRPGPRIPCAGGSGGSSCPFRGPAWAPVAPFTQPRPPTAWSTHWLLSRPTCPRYTLSPQLPPAPPSPLSTTCPCTASSLASCSEEKLSYSSSE